MRLPHSLPPIENLVKPIVALPPGACDTHAHVIGAYPLSSDRSYDPIPIDGHMHARMLAQLGFDRGVLVHASACGNDNRDILDALRLSPERLRGVVSLKPDTPDADIEAFHLAGVRGFRINPTLGGGRGPDDITLLSDRVRDLGWHVELLIDVKTLVELEPTLRASSIPVVLGNMGYFPCMRGTDWPGFHAMVKLAKDGQAFVKVSGACSMTEDNHDRHGITPILEELLHQIPDRLIWGSDWPHVCVYDRMVDTGELLNEFLMLCPDKGLRRRIFTENPAEIYHFP